MVTRNEVLDWLNNNQGQPIAFNNGSDIQCVDLVNYVSQKFFGKAMFIGPTYAKDIWAMNFSDGWQKVPVSQGARPGDIFVMTGEQAGNFAGHTGIISEDGLMVYDENYDNRKYLSKHMINGGFIGFIRPPYSDDNTAKGEEEMTEFAILYGSGVFYVCGTKMKLLTATEWTVLRSVYSQVTQHKTGKAQEIMIMDWRNNQATFDAYVKICGGYTS